MKRHFALFLFAIVAGGAAPAAAQMTAEQAREEGRAMGNAAKANEDLVPDDKARAEAVPGYTTDSLPQGAYFDDPDKLENDAQALKSKSEQYQITTDTAHTRPTFSNSEILATTNRATAVENDPTTYLEGEEIGSGAGTCRPLPPGSGTGSFYEASCNVGTKVEQTSVTCNVPLVVNATPGENGGEVVTEAKDEGLCAAATSGKTCELTSETCIDAAPATRVVNGVPVTRACWGWNRTYTCNSLGTGNDCGSLSANPKCTYLRDECLDEPGQGGGACQTVEKVYKCETPSGTSPATKQYICGDDVYCLNGDCEPIERQASTEFKDALVALHAIDQAGKEFDETNFRVFAGKRETCHKPVFGLINCCAGKVSGAVPVAAGAAALGGGPAAIAAFATPFLVLFSCSQDEMKLDIKDRMGFCHKVGTYCSSSVLGICKTKRTAYCCFESKLSRILQEQGRLQLGKPWGSPKKEQCQGFTIEEFASLDLSVMDFTEVYSDFMDAAKLPDEVQTMTEIQTKIQDYYDLHGQ